MTGDWRDDPIATAAVSLANTLEAMELPDDTCLRGVRGGIEITEPGKPTYTLKTPPVGDAGVG